MGRDWDVLGLESHSRAKHVGEEDGFPIKDVGNDKRGRPAGMTRGGDGGHDKRGETAGHDGGGGPLTISRIRQHGLVRVIAHQFEETRSQDAALDKNQAAFSQSSVTQVDFGFFLTPGVFLVQSANH